MRDKKRLSLTVDERTWERFRKMASIYKITVSHAVIIAFWIFLDTEAIERPIYKRKKKLINRTIICNESDRGTMRARKANFGLTWDELIESSHKYITDNASRLNNFREIIKETRND